MRGPEVARRVDGVAGRPAEAGADGDHEQGHGERADLGGGLAEGQQDEEEHEGADRPR